jgi:hypothetical protein
MHYNVFTGYKAEPAAFSETNATESAYGKHKLLYVLPAAAGTTAHAAGNAPHEPDLERI